MEQLKLKINTFLSFLKNKKLRNHFLIDIIFYGYIIFVFPILSKISIIYELQYITTIFIWIGMLIPILILKFLKNY